MNTRRAIHFILLLAVLVLAILGIRSILGSQAGAPIEVAYPYPPPPASPASGTATDQLEPYPPPPATPTLGFTPDAIEAYPPPSTPAPVPTPLPNQKLSAEAMKTIAYISAKEQIDPKFLVVDADHPTEYPNLGRRFQVVSMLDPRPGGEGYKLLVDLDTGEIISDIVSLLEAERAARVTKYGKYDQSLLEELQSLQDEDLVKVVIWVTSEPGKDMYQIQAEAYATLAAKYPEAQEAMEKFGVPYDVEDADLGKKLLKEYIQLIRAPVEKRKQPLLEILEAGGYEPASPEGLPAMYVTLAKKDLLAIAERDDVGFISLDEGLIEQITSDCPTPVPSAGEENGQELSFTSLERHATHNSLVAEEFQNSDLRILSRPDNFEAQGKLRTVEELGDRLRAFDYENYFAILVLEGDSLNRQDQVEVTQILRQGERVIIQAKLPGPPSPHEAIGNLVTLPYHLVAVRKGGDWGREITFVLVGITNCVETTLMETRHFVP